MLAGQDDIEKYKVDIRVLFELFETALRIDSLDHIKPCEFGICPAISRTPGSPSTTRTVPSLFDSINKRLDIQLLFAAVSGLKASI